MLTLHGMKVVLLAEGGSWNLRYEDFTSQRWTMKKTFGPDVTQAEIDEFKGVAATYDPRFEPEEVQWDELEINASVTQFFTTQYLHVRDNPFESNVPPVGASEEGCAVIQLPNGDFQVTVVYSRVVHYHWNVLEE